MRRYELLFYSGSGRLLWLFIIIDLGFIIFGPLATKMVFGVLLFLNVAGLLFPTEHYVCVARDCVRIYGFGRPIKVAFHQIERVGEPSSSLGPLSRLVTMFAQVRTPGLEPFWANVELVLTRRKWVLMLNPIPFAWPSKKFRLPVSDGSSLISEVSARLARTNEQT